MAFTISFINHTEERMPKSFLEEKLTSVVRNLSRRGFKAQLYKRELVIVYVGQKQVQALNKKYRGKDYATDVLSFGGFGPVLGELVLCPQVLKKQAEEHKLSFRDENLYLTIHGLLHLLGMDHERGGGEAEKMYALQDELFAKALKS